MESRSVVYSPNMLLAISGQLRRHLRQKVKWLATELVKSGYLVRETERVIRAQLYFSYVGYLADQIM